MDPNKKNVLIAVDGSDQSFEAVRYVGRVMPSGWTRITLLHVMDLFPEVIWDLEWGLDLRNQLAVIEGWETQQRSMIRDFLQRARLFLMSRDYSENDISIVVRDRVIDVALDIAKEAQKGYDALVVGRHGVSRPKDLVFGSISSKLLGLLKQVPLWVIGGNPEPRKSIVAMDNSEGASRALDYVGSIFQRSHPDLLLLYISRKISLLDPEYRELVPIKEGRDWLERANREIEASELRMESYLQGCIKRLEEQGADRNRIKAKLVDEAISRSQTILDEALAGGYGTIVMGRRGLSKIDEFLMGRVSSKVLQLAKDRAVWIVH